MKRDLDKVFNWMLKWQKKNEKKAVLFLEANKCGKTGKEWGAWQRGVGRSHQVADLVNKERNLKMKMKRVEKKNGKNKKQKKRKKYKMKIIERIKIKTILKFYKKFKWERKKYSISTSQCRGWYWSILFFTQFKLDNHDILLFSAFLTS